MLSLILSMIVAGTSAAPTTERYPQARDLYACAFDVQADRNYDNWPDGWTRKRGPGYPHYLSIQIAPPQSPGTPPMLRVALDGGAAAVMSPTLPIDPHSTYVLQGRIRPQGLRYDRAYLALTFLGPAKEVLETRTSQRVQTAKDWVAIELGPVAPRSPQASYVQVELHVASDGPEQDLTGTVSFADIWVGQLPRLVLATNHPHNLFLAGDAVEIHCTASGLPQETALVNLSLENALGRTLDQIELPFPAAPGEEASAERQAHWKPSRMGPGFYRVRAALRSKDALVHEGSVSLAVASPAPPPAQGEFGWSLPGGESPIPHAELARLLSQAGVNWVKYPLWLESDVDPDRLTRLVLFFERLNGQGIEVVGLLDHPPAKFCEELEVPSDGTAADVFSLDAKTWGQSLQRTVTQAASHVRRWQLGGDDDTSFVGYPRLAAKISEVKAQFDRLGADVQLGIAWNWLAALPLGPGNTPPCTFLTLSADPPMTHEETAAYLDAMPPGYPGRWLVLRPLSRKAYAIPTRAEDLVRRMAAAKIHGAEAVFCPRPFDDDEGLMNADGTPGELFLPWRTTATLLGGSEYLGSLELPERSPNLVFARGDEAVMLLWNGSPTEEVLHVGEAAQQVSLWGEARTPAALGDGQVLEAAPLPSFVTGWNGAVARWSIGCTFQNDRIPSTFGEPHANACSWTNTFPQGVSGRARLVLPDTWRVEPREISFRLAEGESLSVPFTVTLPFDANSGKHPLRVDFEVEAEKTYRFSVYRRVQVGTGSVYVEMATRLNEQDELEVEQRFINDTQEPVSFRCLLYAPDRRRLKIEIRHLGPGRDVQVYRLPNGRELLGKYLWLRAEELGGRRVLNYRFVATGG